MTGTRDPQQDGSIHAMLSDSGLETAAELRSALEQLHALVPEAAPKPRADLVAMLTSGTARAAGPDAVVVNLADRRRAGNRRLAIVGGAVIGAMSLGAGAVAASSEDFRHSVSQTVGVIFQPSGHATQAPEHVQPSPASVPAFPAPAGTAPAGTSGTALPSSGAPAGAARDDGKEAAEQAGHTPPVSPPAVGRDGILPAPGHGPQAPGLPTMPGNPGGSGGEDLPRVPGYITPTLPAIVPTKAPDHS
ncbi:hypothetical protein SAMN04487914_13010 [Arthrobacter sp. ok909]|uniref:hypothetical protein n=1 Tax=Arthrobacter sp. ok909 TaxID=1761746 RepID=UPI00087FD6FA|nr:hypothetical protein [Arthrobacter sp. ok909]SDP72093.1 hypothetical protein SAMN04487914_13010 [Arthrobacter sp. ok909]